MLKKPSIYDDGNIWVVVRNFDTERECDGNMFRPFVGETVSNCASPRSWVFELNEPRGEYGLHLFV